MLKKFNYSLSGSALVAAMNRVTCKTGVFEGAFTLLAPPKHSIFALTEHGEHFAGLEEKKWKGEIQLDRFRMTIADDYQL